MLDGIPCTHEKHDRVARGRDPQGRSNAAESAAYPLGLVALLVWILLRPEAWRVPGQLPRLQFFSREALQPLAQAIERQQQANQVAASALLAEGQLSLRDTAA